jgi:hypothetical protein
MPHPAEEDRIDTLRETVLRVVVGVLGNVEADVARNGCAKAFIISGCISAERPHEELFRAQRLQQRAASSLPSDASAYISAEANISRRIGLRSDSQLDCEP